MTEAEILDDFLDLTHEDLKACIAYLCCRPRTSVYERFVTRMKLLFDENLSPKLPHRLDNLLILG